MLRVVKHEDTGDGFSVLIHDPKAELSVWVDVWKRDGEVMSDWNMYIFHHWNDHEMKVKAYQEAADNLTECTSEAEYYLSKLGLI